MKPSDKSTPDLLRGAAERILLVSHRSSEEHAIVLRSVAADLMKLATSNDAKAIVEAVSEAVDLNVFAKK